MANYFLHVDLTLNDTKKDGAKFEQLVGKFLADGAFGAGKLVPRLFLRTISAAKGAAPDYVNLWIVADMTDLDLANVMNDSRDDPVYTQIDPLVSMERQEFVFPDGQVDKRNSAKPAAGADKAHFVRVVHEFPDSGTYGRYAENIISMAIYVENSGWDSAGVFWSVTGQLNTFTEFWSVPAGTDEKLQTMLDAARKGGAPNDVTDAYKSYPQTSRLLLAPYVDLTPTAKQPATASGKGGK